MISAAPSFWRPTFVGGRTLGSGLNASLLRKLQILAFWLETIFPGVVIQLVQGSPSGSSASGGTHAGPGDACDLRILVNGRQESVNVYVIASLILRLLGCLAYVRGQDVNGDGVKDDSFDPHLHVIDREGGNKAPAAGIQIMQYLAHQNGLIGGRTDYEVLVRNPIWLADYTDDLFRARFMALTPAAAALEVHTEPAPAPQEEDDMDMFQLVKSFYEHDLGRDASTDEVNRHALAAIKAGTTPAALYAALLVTPEATDPKVRHDRIASYYRTILNRTGSEAEVMGWVNSGKPLGEIRELITIASHTPGA